ncbi:MAG TPA: hypothetical protein VI685_21140 [Candidatus Angelobacter sp.]
MPHRLFAVLVSSALQPLVLILAVAFAGAIALQAQESAKASDSVKKELAREYKNIEHGFRRDDPAQWIEHLSPDFELVLFNGQHQSRQWAVDYVHNNAKTFHVRKLTMRIQNIEFGDADVTAIVEQKSERTFVENGQAHRLNVGALQQNHRRLAAETGPGMESTVPAEAVARAGRASNTVAPRKNESTGPSRSMGLQV